MQDYKIKRAGREFVVLVGDSQILKCATRREAMNAILAAKGEPSRRWYMPLGLERALSYIRDMSRNSN